MSGSCRSGCLRKRFPGAANWLGAAGRPSIVLVAAWLGISAAGAQSLPAFLDVPAYATERLADGLYSFRWGAYRNIFLVSDEGVVATDPFSDEAAAVYREEIRRITSAPVRYLVYSQSHWDHVSGGGIFKAEGAQVVAQERCAANMKARYKPDLVLPDITFTDHYRIALGSRSLDLFYFGPADDDCGIVMVARPAALLYVTDSVNPGPAQGVPWNPMIPDLHLYNVVPFFARIEALVREQQIDQYVGGHITIVRGAGGKAGLYPTTGPVAQISERRRFWERVISAVARERDRGIPPALIADEIDLEQFADLPGYSRDGAWILTRRIAAYLETGR